MFMQWGPRGNVWMNSYSEKYYFQTISLDYGSVGLFHLKDRYFIFQKWSSLKYLFILNNAMYMLDWFIETQTSFVACNLMLIVTLAVNIQP